MKLLTPFLVRTGIYPWFYPARSAIYREMSRVEIGWPASVKILQMPKGAVCIDCGSHAGDITQILHDCGGRVISFEPNTDLYQKQLQRFAENPNITVFNRAVWHKSTHLPLRSLTLDGVPNLGGSSILEFEQNDHLLQSTLQENTEVIDLIAYIRDLLTSLNVSSVYVLKLDIEGAEFEILTRLIEEGLYKQIRFIFCETHARFLSDGETKLEKVKQLIIDNNINNISLDWI